MCGPFALDGMKSFQVIPPNDGVLLRLIYVSMAQNATHRDIIHDT
jgi:hypothetical protein